MLELALVRLTQDGLAKVPPQMSSAEVEIHLFLFHHQVPPTSFPPRTQSPEAYKTRPMQRHA